MPRIARVVVVGAPHHVVQRGVRKMFVFFSDEDRTKYLQILHEKCRLHGLEIWAYCLMDNHVHLVVVPQKTESLAQAIGQTHWHYTRHVNFRNGWKGYLWQGRFYSHPMDMGYLYSAVRYVEQNPVRAGLVRNACDYRWSSARSRVFKTHDPVLSDYFLTKDIEDWSKFLEIPLGDDKQLLEKHLETGRPLGRVQ